MRSYILCASSLQRPSYLPGVAWVLFGRSERAFRGPLDDQRAGHSGSFASQVLEKWVTALEDAYIRTAKNCSVFWRQSDFCCCFPSHFLDRKISPSVRFCDIRAIFLAKIGRMAKNGFVFPCSCKRGFSQSYDRCIYNYNNAAVVPSRLER
jgi:hypothetical protein